METETKQLYKSEGQMAGGAVGAIIQLVVGVGVATLVLIFVGTLGGQTYNLTEDKINNISDETIKANIQNSIKASFASLEDVADYLPIIILAVVISLVMFLVLGFTAFGGMGGRGSAL
jgi:hypothetical protein